MKNIITLNKVIYTPDCCLINLASCSAYRLLFYILQNADKKNLGKLSINKKELYKVLGIANKSKKEAYKRITEAISELVSKNIFRYKSGDKTQNSILITSYSESQNEISFTYNHQILEYLKYGSTSFKVDLKAFHKLSGLRQCALYLYFSHNRDAKDMWKVSFDQFRFALGLDASSYTSSRCRHNIIKRLLGIKDSGGSYFENIEGGNLATISEKTGLKIKAKVYKDQISFKIESNDRIKKEKIKPAKLEASIIDLETQTKWTNLIQTISREHFEEIFKDITLKTLIQDNTTQGQTVIIKLPSEDIMCKIENDIVLQSLLQASLSFVLDCKPAIIYQIEEKCPISFIQDVAKALNETIEQTIDQLNYKYDETEKYLIKNTYIKGR